MCITWRLKALLQIGNGKLQTLMVRKTTPNLRINMGIVNRLFWATPVEVFLYFNGFFGEYGQCIYSTMDILVFFVFGCIYSRQVHRFQKIRPTIWCWSYSFFEKSVHATIRSWSLMCYSRINIFDVVSSLQCPYFWLNLTLSKWWFQVGMACVCIIL